MNNFPQNIEIIKNRINLASKKTKRTQNDIKIIAVSKKKSIEEVMSALNTGQRVFGENRVQEAITKFTILKKKFNDIELHLIGALQTNKVADAIALFDVIQTLDRSKLANKISKEMKRQESFPRLYIQVNIGNENQKSGVLPQNLRSFYDECINKYGLKIDGLMCIPPKEHDPAPFFLQLKSMAKDLCVKNISMGMSGDFEIAIENGATEVRIGTSLFRKRP